MTERSTDEIAKERLADAKSPLQKQLSSRKAHLTPAQAQQYAERVQGGAASKPTGRICSRGPDVSRDLSFAQERLWLVQQMDPDDRSLLRPVTVRMVGQLDVPCLENSLMAVCLRHEILRATFPLEDRDPRQRIQPMGPVNLRFVDASALQASERERHTQNLFAEEMREGIDLTRGPILRGKLVRWGEEEHVLLLLTHHIVFDAWSSEILLGDLFAEYKQRIQGLESELSPLPISYADYAQWQRQRFEEDAYDRPLDYWTGMLGHLPARVEMPLDRVRLATPASDGACERCRLDPEVIGRLETLARSESASLFSVLLTAFAVLLLRYAGEEDIVVGTPVAGRDEAETEGLIGPFINHLALRCDLSGDPMVRDLVRRIRGTVLDALEHRRVPFEKVIEAVHPEREVGRPPLFDVMFNLENIPQRVVLPPGLAVEPYELTELASGFDLMVEVRRGIDEAWLCEFGYRTELFDRDTMKRALSHYMHLLSSMAEDAECPISSLSMLSDAERHTLLVEWNDTQHAYPTDRCIHELFEAQVDRTPDRIAVICGDELVTYRELADRVQHLAEHLRREGLHKNDSVGIYLERSVNQLVSILATLEAGGVYVPFDLDVPQERAGFMLEDAAVHYLITLSGLDSDLTAWSGKRVSLDDVFLDKEEADGPERTSAQPHPEDTACIIYTSGSTGNPKGVMLTHRGVVNHLLGTWDVLDLKLEDVILLTASASFDASLFSLFGPLLHGSCVVLLRELEAKDPLDIIKTIQTKRVTTIDVVPTLLSSLVETIHSQGIGIPSLRIVSVGGEVVSQELAEDALTTLGPQLNLYNSYGPTEATGFATTYRIENVPLNQSSIPIGRPLPNVSVYVLDRSMQLTGIGIPGEICLGGAGVAKGYINRPEQTAERFVRNPFEPNSILYKTGDHGRW